MEFNRLQKVSINRSRPPKSFQPCRIALRSSAWAERILSKCSLMLVQSAVASFKSPPMISQLCAQPDCADSFRASIILEKVRTSRAASNAFFPYSAKRIMASWEITPSYRFASSSAEYSPEKMSKAASMTSFVAHFLLRVSRMFSAVTSISEPSPMLVITLSPSRRRVFMATPISINASRRPTVVIFAFSKDRQSMVLKYPMPIDWDRL